ncbi:MAG: ABC transporter permease [Actinomycetota bacterium]|nr:ABC transporter permease [Actinomycetota bacterium]
MAAVWFRLLAEARQRWRAWLALSLLCGLGGGVVLAAVAGARRTDSAYDRFLKETNAFDVAVAGLGFPSVDLDAIRRLPQVVDSAGLTYAFFELEGSSAEVGSLAPLIPMGDGFYERISRPKALEGRLPNHERPDEVVVSPLAAEHYGIEVGDTVTLAAFAPDQIESVFSGAPVTAAGRRFPVTVVGITATATEFLPTSPNPEAMHLTPAFYRLHAADVANVPAVALKLRRGSADVPAFKADVERMSEGRPVQFISTDQDAAQVERSIHLQAVAIQVFAAVAALATVLILSQALARQAAADSQDNAVLRSLGTTSGQLWTTGLCWTGLVAAAGAALAVAVAYALSPLAPFGLARQAEPDPGPTFDAALLAGGALVLLVALAVAVPAIWRAVRLSAVHLPPGRLPLRPPSRLVERLAGLGLPPPAVAGVRMAVEPGRGTSWLPTRNALLTSVFCLGAVVVAATYAASLQHLLHTPRLYGWGWDAVIGNPYTPDTVDEAVPAITASGLVDGLSSVAFTEVGVEGRRVTALAFAPVTGRVLPPVVDGREPHGADEVLLGSRTLREIDRTVGDVVTVRVGDRMAQARVVGRGVLPNLSDTLGVSSLGESALFTEAGLRRLVPDVARNLFAVRFSDAADQAESFRQLSARFGGEEPAPPKSVADFGRVDSLPAVLTALLALLAVATLAHTSVTVVRRRRRELAILKALGFLRAQVRATVAFQATAIVTIALVVAVPLGLVAGRWTWRTFADGLGIVPQPVIPLWVAVGIVPVAILAANVIAAIPGRLASRVPTAAALQVE